MQRGKSMKSSLEMGRSGDFKSLAGETLEWHSTVQQTEGQRSAKPFLAKKAVLLPTLIQFGSCS